MSQHHDGHQYKSCLLQKQGGPALPTTRGLGLLLHQEWLWGPTSGWKLIQKKWFWGWSVVLCVFLSGYVAPDSWGLGLGSCSKTISSAAAWFGAEMSWAYSEAPCCLSNGALLSVSTCLSLFLLGKCWETVLEKGKVFFLAIAGKQLKSTGMYSADTCWWHHYQRITCCH